MVHHAAAVGFQRAAGAYERGRPGYPPQVVDWLLARLGRDVVDLAAGTGKLTRELLAAGARVTAIEPVEAMRAALPAQAGALQGTAEAIPLPPGRVDGVVVAQAWHWFDAPRALGPVAGLAYRCEAEAWTRLDAGSTDSP